MLYLLSINSPWVVHARSPGESKVKIREVEKREREREREGLQEMGSQGEFCVSWGIVFYEPMALTYFISFFLRSTSN